jgi:hypothetical protein
LIFSQSQLSTAAPAIAGTEHLIGRRPFRSVDQACAAPKEAGEKKDLQAATGQLSGA